ncbi:MAG TPA: sugar phosphate isomerase/epimerase [Aggregatilineales bacterium]|nr:sugar phosphate isomerase/epimerase [Aggregatilineales bacterium]
MAIPIALALYSVREDLAKDFPGVMRKVAQMGYLGVETAGFPGTTPAQAAAVFRSLDLKVVSAHSPLPLGPDKTQILDNVLAVSSDTLICPWLDPETYYQSVDGISRARDLLNEANAVCKAHNLTFGYHNHWFEYGKIDGQYAADILRDGLSPDIIFEVDTYWARTAGADPVDVIRTLGKRAPLLHIKDGPCVREAPMVAFGEGKLDIVSIGKAAQETAKWLFVELDRCATDMLEAVEKSYEYLVRESLGYGREAGN